MEGETLSQVIDAIVGAFSEDELEELVLTKLGAGLFDDLAAPRKPFRTIVFDLLRAVERRGQTAALLDAVAAARPHKAELQQRLRRLRGDLQARGAKAGAPNPPARARRNVPRGLGVALAFAALCGMLALGVTALHHDEPSREPPPDFVTFLSALALVDKLEVRIRLWTARYGAPDENVRGLLSNLSSAPPRAGHGADVKTELSTAQTSPEIEKVFDSHDFASCGGDFHFLIREGMLACRNNDPIANVTTSKQGGARNATDMVILHATGSDSLEGAVQALGSGAIPASVHLIVSRNGAIIQQVPLNRIAWHAAKFNAHSIGIEFVNAGDLDQTNPFPASSTDPIPPASVTTLTDKAGRKRRWQTFSKIQIAAAEGVLAAIYSEYGKLPVQGHADVDPQHSDPGPAFPMQQFCADIGCPASPTVP